MIARAALIIVIIAAPIFAQTGESLRKYETRYYVLKTDIAEDEAREASLRMTKMAEEYALRTRDFAREIRTRFPFYLIHDDQLYLKLGGVEGSAGLFNGQALVVHVPDHVNARVWHVLQHEGFHQFAHAVIGGQRPVWVNEGLAEYFGEAAFTGDGFLVGIVPQWRLERVRNEIAANQFSSIDRMMQMTDEQWNSKLSVVNYDQGWSMVHFLVHGDGGKYRQAFSKFINDLGSDQTWQTAWKNNFGDTLGFEQRWRNYWQNLPDKPTAELYAKATVATLASYLARATAEKQSFATFDAFVKTARAGQLKISQDQWLPPTLLDDALASADAFVRDGVKFSILSAQGTPRLSCTLANGSHFVGHFKLRGSEVIAAGVEGE